MYFHITWHTKVNMPMVTPSVEPELYKYVKHKVIETRDAIFHAVGGIEDHIHLVVSLPPTVQPAEWIGRIKGASSHHINQSVGPKKLQWQNGYGIVTFGAKDLKWVVGYVENQKERHKTGNISERLERITHLEDDYPDDEG
jgi:putative transposase